MSRLSPGQITSVPQKTMSAGPKSAVKLKADSCASSGSLLFFRSKTRGQFGAKYTPFIPDCQDERGKLPLLQIPIRCILADLALRNSPDHFTELRELRMLLAVASCMSLSASSCRRNPSPTAFSAADRTTAT